MNNAISNAYQTAMNAAKIDQNSMTLTGHTLTVDISGRTMTATVALLTVDGIKAAAVEALADYCALEATLAVAGLA